MFRSVGAGGCDAPGDPTTLIFWVAMGAAGHLKKFRDSPQ